MEQLKPRPSVTVVVPFWRNTQYLRLAIESLINQTNTNWLAIIVNDSSDPELEACIADLLDERFSILVSSTPRGIPGSWNFGLDQVTTEFACVLHGDDILTDSYLHEMQRMLLEIPSATAGFCNVTIIDEMSRRSTSVADLAKFFLKRRHRHGTYLEVEGLSGLISLLRADWIYCPTLMFNLHNLKSLRFDEKWKFVPDYAFLLDLLNTGHLLIGHRSNLYKYRRHQESETARMTRNLSRFVEERDLLKHWSSRTDIPVVHKLRLIAYLRASHRAHVAVYVLRFLIKGRFREVKQLLLIAFAR